jgi:predicted ester cyclase
LANNFAGIDATGRGFRIDQAVICHLRDGKVAEAWEIADVGAIVDQID